MAKTSVIRARIEPKLKEEVEKILNDLGMSFSEAINIFAAQIKINNGLPFQVKRQKKPNKDTLEAINDIKNNSNLLEYDGSEYLKAFRKRAFSNNETNQGN